MRFLIDELLDTRRAMIGAAGIAACVTTACSAFGQAAPDRRAAAAARNANVANVVGAAAGSLRRGVAVNGRTLNIIATDTSVSIPESTTEGTQWIALTERSKGSRGTHAVFVARVPMGMPLEDVQRAVADGRLEQLGLSTVGGPGVPDSTGKSRVLAELRQGVYVVSVAKIGANGRKTFSPKSVGLLQVIRVMKFNAFDHPLLTPIVRLRDSKVELSEPLPPGLLTLQIQNRGSRARGLVIRRLEPGATKEEALRWLATRKGDAPFTYVLSTTPMSSERTVHTNVRFEPGDYLFSLDATGTGAGAADGATVVTIK